MSDSEQDRQYVPRGAETVWTGLSGFRNVTLHGFVVDADRARLDEMLQRYIERPSEQLGLRIDVASPFGRVLLLFIESQRFQLPPQSSGESEGSHYEKLFAVVVFGRQKRARRGLFAFAPYVCTSLTPAWRMEREIFGYPRVLAEISISADEERLLPHCLDVRAYGIEHFAPDAISKKCGILSIVKKRDADETTLSWDELVERLVSALSQGTAPTRHIAPGRHRPTGSRPRFGITAADVSFLKRRAREARDRDAADNGPGDDLSKELTEALRDGVLRMLFLKQFRDIVYADRACYQAIVEAPLTMTGLGDAMASPSYELRIENIDSAPISRELGVPVDPSNVALAFRLPIKCMEIGDRHTPGTVISNPFWNPGTETASPGESPRLPKYVDRGGEAVWRQPSLLCGARIYGFGVKVDPKHQAEILDKYVNSIVENRQATEGPDSNDKFRLVPAPGMGVVMLMFAEYDKVISENDDDARLGGVSYREFLAMQLALYDDPEFSELDWLIPFIYLDKDSPRLGGREIYGYPKQIGEIPSFVRFNRGSGIEPAQKLELKGIVIPKEGDQVAESKAIVTIEALRPPATIEPYMKAYELITDLLEVRAPSSVTGPGMGHLFPADVAGPSEAAVSGSQGVNAVLAVASGTVGHVFLKQFRDCARPQTACYQAVCKTDTVPGRFRGGASIDPTAYRITISDFASEPLLKYLDKSSRESPYVLTPDFAYWMDLDIELTTGRVIANPLHRQAREPNL